MTAFIKLGAKPVLKCIALFSALIISTAVNAAVIQYSGSHSVESFVALDTKKGAASGSDLQWDFLTLQGFDSSLGTLTGVEIFFETEWSHNGYFSAIDKKDGCPGAKCQNDTWVTGKAVTEFNVALYDPYAAFDDKKSKIKLSCEEQGKGRAECDDVEWSSGFFSGYLDLSGLELADFVDPADGDINFAFSSLTDVSLKCDNNDKGDKCEAVAWSGWSGTTRVSYSYDVVAMVSEPSNIELLIAGLLALVFTRARKKRL